MPCVHPVNEFHEVRLWGVGGGELVAKLCGRCKQQLSPAPDYYDDPLARLLSRLCNPARGGAVTCRGCGIKLIPQDVWIAATKTQRAGWRSIGHTYTKARGYCAPCYTTSRRGNQDFAGPVHTPWPLPGRWALRALCAQVGGDHWYPEGHQTHAARQAATARAVCARCPVTTACLDYALANEDDDHRWGIWGGTTPDQRRQLRQEAS